MSRMLDRISDQVVKQQISTFNTLWKVVEDCASILKEISPGHRRPWLMHVVVEIYEAQGGVCPCCRKAIDFGQWHVDHVIPFSWGGGNERGNLQVLHPRCNQQKGDVVDVFDLLRYLEDRYMNL